MTVNAQRTRSDCSILKGFPCHCFDGCHRGLDSFPTIPIGESPDRLLTSWLGCSGTIFGLMFLISGLLIRIEFRERYSVPRELERS